MSKYKTIGILGGMGPEATADLYLRIIQIFQKKYGAIYDFDFPEIIILNLPIPDVVEKNKEGDEVKDMLISGVKRLENAGARFIAIPCNTVTYYISDMQKAAPIPIINILQEAANTALKEGLRKVGLLGTEMTIKNKIYDDILDKIEILKLNEKEQKETTKVIINILSGKKTEEDKVLLERFINKLRYNGAEKVILGCTELPLIIKNNEYVIDTLQILAEESVRRSVNKI